MSYDIMKYLSFGTRLTERNLTKRLMDQVKYLIRTHRWNPYQTLEEWKKDPLSESDSTIIKTFFVRHEGQDMLAVVLFFRIPCYVPNYVDVSWCCCVFADDYVYLSQPLSFNSLWGMNLQWDEEVFDNLSRYHSAHPRAGLAVYLDRYRQMKDSSGCFEPIQLNFMILLFAQYNKGLELLVKAELYYLTRTMFQCDSEEDTLLTMDQGEPANLKEWLGVSMNVLKKLDQMLKGDCRQADPFRFRFRKKGWWYVTGRTRYTHRVLANQEFFARLADIADYNSEYLNLPAFTPTALQFFMENHLIHHKPLRGSYMVSRRITGIARMTDLQVIKVIRHIAKLPGSEAREYMWYLNYCGKFKSLDIKEYPFGLCPKNTQLAVEEASNMYEHLYKKDLSRRFRQRTREDSYQFLKSDKDESADTDDYCISVPEKVEDMLRESRDLGHCVKDYCEDVANGSTYILFLRKADKPDVPFVTMEVTRRYRLVQAKARGNEPATVEAQEYIRRWAGQKGLVIDTNDLSETA